MSKKDTRPALHLMCEQELLDRLDLACERQESLAPGSRYTRSTVARLAINAWLCESEGTTS